MNKKNSVVPVEDLEVVAVSLNLTIADCSHLEELFLNIMTALPYINTDKVTLMSAYVGVMDPETGKLKYTDEPRLLFANLNPEESIAYSPGAYYVSEDGLAVNEDGEVIFDLEDN